MTLSCYCICLELGALVLCRLGRAGVFDQSTVLFSFDEVKVLD